MENTEKMKTVIGEDVEIVGSIKSASHIQLDGKLSGDLTSTGNTVIGASASVKGNLSVNSTTIYGQVTGNITAKDRIELKSSARLNGDIRAKRLAVEDGVTFVGKSEVNPSGAQGGQPAPQSEPTAPSGNEGDDKDDKKGGMFGKK